MSAERYSFVCNNGCGVCRVKLTSFEYERVETLEGELVSSKSRPQVVSACCGGDVHAYDNQTDDWGGLVDVIASQLSAKPERQWVPERTPIAPGAAEGWKWVPLKPTEAMMEAAFQAHEDKPLSDWGKIVPANDDEIYRAMVLASPSKVEKEPRES